MATTIKGTVSRVMPNTNNFFVRPDEDQDVRHVDLDGHRVGDGEINSALNMGATRPRVKPWTGDLPKVGDKVELHTVD